MTYMDGDKPTAMVANAKMPIGSVLLHC
jgi:hypothetical protein